MRVRMVVGLSGTIDGADWPPAGGEVEVLDAIAVDLLANGYAVAATDAVETAAMPIDGVETADMPRGRRK